MWAPTAVPVAIAPDLEADASKPTGDVADTGQVADIGPGVDKPDQPPVPAPPPSSSSSSSQSPLQRHALQMGAEHPQAQYRRQQQQQQQHHQQQQDAYAPYTAVEAAPTDSLSLLQLRRIVAEVNRTEPVAYDFEYTDMGPHAEEIDEWFTYQFWQWVRLNSAQRAFEWHWESETADAAVRDWDRADDDRRVRFVRAAIAGVQSNDAALRSASIGKLVYLVLGRWGNTANPMATVDDCRSVASTTQLQAIKDGVDLLVSLEGLPVVWEALRNTFEMHW